MGRALAAFHAVPHHPASPSPNGTTQLHAPRSLLAVPADKPKLLESATRRPASALMIDLEDGVASTEKGAARAAAAKFVSSGATAATVLVRINDPATADGQHDLRAIDDLAAGPDAVIVPKSTVATVEAVADLINRPLVALIETARGVEEAAAIASLPSVVGLMFGSVDYASDISTVGGWHITNLAWTKSRIINAAAAGGAWALAGPSTALDDGSDLTRDVEEDRALGFAGKLCIHPAQLDRVNTAFAPSADQVAWATRILDVVGDGDIGAVRIDGQMIDKPVVDRARTILDADRRTPA